MADGAEIRSRISSVTETKKVTDAMYLISSVKLKRAKREVEKTTPYFQSLKEEIGELFQTVPETENRYFKAPDPAAGQHLRRGILLVTSDKGLASSYNQSVIALAESYLAHHPETLLFIVGEYGRHYFSTRGEKVVSGFGYSAELPTVWKARKMCADLLEYFDDGRVDEIDVFYTDYIAGKPSEAKRNVLLPLQKSRFASEGQGTGGETEFYPDPDAVLSAVVPSYLTGFIYGCLVDSYCSEQQARMEAMSSAGHNAEKMIRELTIRYNGIRQAAITAEMTEIAAGARATKKNGKRTQNGGNHL